MADIRPFRAYRPCSGMEEKIAALPYDVYSRKEAKAYVDKHPESFLAIDRPETQFDDSVGTYDDCVYEKARELLDRKIEDGDFVQDEKPCYYLYEQTMNGRSQTGICAAAAVGDYQSGVIKKHENTVEAKEQDRIRHVDACGAQTGPIFLAYRGDEAINAVTARVLSTEPVCDFLSEGGVRNRVWVIDEPEDIESIQAAFQKIGSIYIADGHHRCASAVKVSLMRKERSASEAAPSAAAAKGPGQGTVRRVVVRKRPLGQGPARESDYFLCVLFPDDQLEIMDYNRVVKDLNGLTKEEILGEVKRNFNVRPFYKDQAKPTVKGEIGMYLGGKWYMLTARNDIKSGDPVDGLDVSILQNVILTPLFGISDPRTDSRIEFVGGIRGLDELERRADECKGVAFAMYPTSIRELFAVADAGRLMPPKSTWFEPKLLSGLFIHRIDD